MRSEIIGDKIILRKYEIGFAPLLFEAANESKGGEFSRWMPWCHENYTIAESQTFIESLEEKWQNGKVFGFAIFDRKTNEFLGGTGLNQPSRIHKFYNLGYWIRVSRQNRGIVSEAARLLAKSSFEDLPINRIEILTAVENVPSCKAAEKSGATREGILRKRLVIGDCRVHDAVIFSFIREDFGL
jgi:RimJ/RimL family protein N-acetyltransferase